MYDPFPQIAAWLGALVRRDLPSSFEIDEEGSDILLALFPTADPHTGFFILERPYGHQVILQGLGSIDQVIEDLTSSLRDFFQLSYEPHDWGSGGYCSYCSYAGVPWSLRLESLMLQDPILAST